MHSCVVNSVVLAKVWHGYMANLQGNKIRLKVIPFCLFLPVFDSSHDSMKIHLGETEAQCNSRNKHQGELPWYSVSQRPFSDCGFTISFIEPLEVSPNSMVPRITC